MSEPERSEAKRVSEAQRARGSNERSWATRRVDQ
jgi:hypothetical protein